jgi:hypothetical protein
MSDSINELATALAKAQAEIKNATQNKMNPHFRSKYADLANIREAITPYLAKQGLSISQISHIREGVDGMPAYVIWRTILMHTSGQYITSEWPIPYRPDKPQAMGSDSTYARRYGLSGVTGIASEEDDDAELASKTSANGKPAPMRYDEDQSNGIAQAMLEQIEELTTLQSLDDYAKEHAGTYGKLSAQHQETVKKATNARREAIKRQA